MLRYTCHPCQRGEHEHCHGKRPPPPGVIGGSECDCDGNCAHNRKPFDGEMPLDVVLANLNSAEEPRHTGQLRWTIHYRPVIGWEVDGPTHAGQKPLPPMQVRAMTDAEASPCADALRAAAGTHDDEAWALALRLDPTGAP